MNIQSPRKQSSKHSDVSAVDRRTILRSAAALPVAALPLAAVLADPRLARAAADSLETVTIETAGGRSVSAALALPEAQQAPAVILIHEWWGLNDQIKAVAADMAQQGYIALAVDLYGGEMAEDPDGAKALMQAVEAEAASDTLVSWSDWLRAHERSTGKVASVGWCFGGGWSLNAATATPLDGCVVYYGRVNKTAGELASLACPVLGHFATKDQWINQEMVSGFVQSMEAAGKQAIVHWYDADHAFANPTGGRYDAEDAAVAWRRTQDYLAQHLG